MNEFIQIGFGVLSLIIAFFLGKFVASISKDELHMGHKWFETILLISFLGVISSAIFRNDALMFTFLFILVFTSRSVRY